MLTSWNYYNEAALARGLGCRTESSGLPFRSGIRTLGARVSAVLTEQCPLLYTGPWFWACKITKALGLVEYRFCIEVVVNLRTRHARAESVNVFTHGFAVSHAHMLGSFRQRCGSQDAASIRFLHEGRNVGRLGH